MRAAVAGTRIGSWCDSALITAAPYASDAKEYLIKDGQGPTDVDV